MLRTSLKYDGGTILIKSIAHIPFATIDPRTNSLRAQALHYSNILSYLDESSLQYDDFVS